LKLLCPALPLEDGYILACPAELSGDVVVEATVIAARNPGDCAPDMKDGAKS
jgi:hypothetical protein